MNIQDLNSDCLTYILQFSNYLDILNLSQTNKFFNTICSKNIQHTTKIVINLLSHAYLPEEFLQQINILKTHSQTIIKKFLEYCYFCFPKIPERIPVQVYDFISELTKYTIPSTPFENITYYPIKNLNKVQYIILCIVFHKEYLFNEILTSICIDFTHLDLNIISKLQKTKKYPKMHLCNLLNEELPNHVEPYVIYYSALTKGIALLQHIVTDEEFKKIVTENYQKIHINIYYQDDALYGIPLLEPFSYACNDMLCCNHPFIFDLDEYLDDNKVMFLQQYQPKTYTTILDIVEINKQLLRFMEDL